MKTTTRARKPLTEDQIFEMEYRQEQARDRAKAKTKAGKSHGFKVEVRKSPAPVAKVYTPNIQPAPVKHITPEVLPPLDDPWDMICVYIVSNEDRHAENVRGFWQDKYQLALPPAKQEVPAPVRGKRAPKTTRVLPHKDKEVFTPPAVIDLDPTQDLIKEVVKRARRENTVARLKEKANGEYSDSYGIYASPGTEIKKANRKVRDTLAAQKRKVTKPADAQKGDYKKLQSSNSTFFKSLPKADQAYLRAQGYNNVGWDKVLKSAKLIEQFKLG